MFSFVALRGHARTCTDAAACWPGAAFVMSRLQVQRRLAHSCLPKCKQLLLAMFDRQCCCTQHPFPQPMCVQWHTVFACCDGMRALQAAPSGGAHHRQTRKLQEASSQPQVTGPHTVVVDVTSIQGFFYLTGGQPAAKSQSEPATLHAAVGLEGPWPLSSLWGFIWPCVCVLNTLAALGSGCHPPTISHQQPARPLSPVNPACKA